MATYSWNTKIRHDSDANFRLWGAEIQTALLAVGCTQTADTGQINWTTVTRAATNSDAGYEIYYINDSLHSTAPVYFKVYYGTAGGASAPRLKIEVGTGSNGSGTITGGNTAAIVGYNSTVTFNTDTTYTSYCGLTNGCLVLANKVGRISTNFALQGFIIARTCDSAGAANADGVMLIKCPATNSFAPQVQVCRFATPSAGWATNFGGSSSFGVWTAPLSEVTSVDENGANQMWLLFAQCLRVRPWSTLAGYRIAEITAFTTVSGVALVGSTTYTFLALDIGLGPAFASLGGGISTSYGLFVVYQ
ncbi:MAG TPA: hypothetical protein PLE54_11580 [Burkholderiaceae bacterium]|nr:hypothetical protein [Burkholderiaceae bacterium]